VRGQLHKLATALGSSSIKLWNVNDGSLVKTFASNIYIHSIAFSPDGTRLLTGGISTPRVNLWNVQTGNLIRSFFFDTGYTQAVAISPDGQTMAATDGFASISTAISFWKLSDGTFLRSVTTNGDVSSIAFSPDSQNLIAGLHENNSGNRASSIREWQVSTGTVVRDYTGHTSWVESVNFSPDGNFIISAAVDGIRLWDSANGTQLRYFDEEIGPFPNSSSGNPNVLSVAFSGDGSKFGYGRFDATAVVARNPILPPASPSPTPSPSPTATATPSPSPTPTPITATSIQRWSVNNGFYGLSIFGDGTLLAAGNTFASGAGSGVKMNPYTGETIAAFPVPDVRTSIRLSTGDQDYVIGGYGDRVELRQDGSVVSTIFGLGCCNIPRYPLALDNTTNQAYVLANWNVGVANMSTGFLRYLPGTGDFVGTVSIADATTLYTAGQAGNVTRVHPLNGFQWIANIDSMQLQPGAVGADGSFVVTSGPAHLENSPQAGRLARVKPDGTVAWNKAMNAVTPPVIGSNNLIFVGTQAPPITETGAGAIEAYDLETGNLAWRTNVQGLPNDLLVGDDGAVYAGTGTSSVGQIYVLGQTDGSVRQTITNVQGAWELLLRGGLLYSAGNAITALPVTAVNYDPNSPWPVRFHDNQRTSSRQNPILNPTRVNNGIVQFSNASYTVGENAGVATITVNRSGGGDGAVSVSYATSDGSATAGSDYTSASGTISWANGEQGPKSFDVPIIDDGTYEGNETINLSLTNATGGATLGTQTSAVLNILENDPTAAGTVLISEFRLRGPLGSNDEFVELYNNSDQPITVQTTDGSNGWTVVTAEGYQFWTINNGTVIPARGHLLGTEYYSQGSSIHNYAHVDTTWGYFDGFGIPDNTGIALFQTSNSNNFNLNYRIDAVGFSSVTNSLYREGAGLMPVGSVDGDYSFVRKQVSFINQDTGNNSADFAFVSTTGSQFNGVQSILGAPGFEGSSSPIRGNSAGVSAISIGLLDTSASSANQNRTFQPIVNGDKGTLELRRKITNNSTSTLSKLRLRVVNITSFPSEPGTADLRVLSSADTQVNTSNGPVTVKGTSLDQPPNQFEKGGGLNSSLNVPLPGGGLAPGASVNIRILLGVCQEGNYLFQLDLPIFGFQGTIAAQTPTPSIYGRVAYISNGPTTGFSGVTISLSGAQSASTTTDVNGNYSFDGLLAGGNYTVSASKNGYIFQPSNISIPSLTNNQQANFTGELPSPNPGEMVISEFRFRGMDSGDEFVELYNNTDQTFTVSTTDGSTGWTVIVDGGYQIIQIPNGTVIPARGHYVGTEYYNQSSSIYQYTQFDTTWGYFDGYQIPDDTGIALFKTANPANYTTAKRLDSVGFSNVSNSLYREGAGLRPLGTSAGEYSFVRRMNGFVAQDTDNNSADFVFVSTNAGVFNGVQSILGSPGPEGLSSPVRGNRPGVAELVASLLDPSAPDGGAPNQVRSFTPVTNGNNGTLEVRRKITNTSNTAITRVRMRVNDISTLGAAGGADLRVLSSPDLNVTLTNGSTVLVKGTTLDQPPNQTSGGGLNSSLSVTLPGGSLAAGASVNVRILLGVQQPGSFQFQLDIPVSVVADTAPPSISNLPGPGAAFNWLQINPNGATPSARRGHRLVYDSDRQKVILFGGIDSQGYLNDVWEFDVARSTWTNVTPGSGSMPIHRADFGMAYDQTRHRVVVYGGSCSDQFSNVGIVGDTWEFDPAVRVWSQGANTIPFFVGLTGSALAYDPTRHQVIAFGGRPYWDWGTDQTWAWNGTSWTDISPAISPGKRHYHSMATDPVRNRIVMFGGRNPNALNDTWEWDGTTWTQVALSGPQPSYRWYPGLTFNESTNTTIMFDSGTSGENLNDTWEWNGSQWRQLFPTTSPTPRGTSMVYDSAQAKLVLFSGAGQADTWVSQIQSEIVLEATSPSGAVATYSPTATDAVDGPVPVNCTPASGSTFPLGTTKVQCSASDSNGNTGQVKFHVTVRDTTAPVLTLPSDITTTAEGSTVVNFFATATDAVSGTTAVNCSPASGSSFALGTTVVQCSATDALNNTAQGSFNVTVQGNTTTGSNVSVQPVDSTTGAPAPVTLTFSQVSGGGTTTVASTGNNPSGQPLPNQFKLGNPPTFYQISTTAQFTPPVTVCFQYPEGAYHNENNLKLMHFNGSIWQDITTSLNTQTNTICGITNSFSPFVTAEIDQPPQLASPPPIAATATTSAGTAVTYNKPVATDDFDSTVSVNCTPQSGSNFALGKTTVVCTATDSAGNSTTKNFDVTVTFAWSGVLDPINTDGTSIFKLKSAVSVKFKLTGASAGVTNAVARLNVTKISNGVMGTELEADSNVSATSGNLFVYDGGGQYHFNWDTKGQQVGTYQLRIDLGDGVSRTVVISLK
jgi:hypothetical protein